MRDFSSTPTPEIFTLHDLVHRLSLRSQSDPSMKNNALFSRAVQDAIRGLPGKHSWKYFIRQARFTTSARMQAEVSYDKTGGGSERILTIVDGVNIWPEDAGLGEVWINDLDKSYRILSRISNTEVVMEPAFSFEDDFTATITWGRSAYQFNREITSVHHMQNITLDRPIAFVPTADFQDIKHSHWGFGITEVCTWQNHGSYFGASDFVLTPVPESVYEIEVTATTNPIIPRIHLISGTPCSITAGSSQLVCSGESFSEKVIGSIVRVSCDGTEPTYYNNREFDFQAFIVSADGDTLTLSETASKDLIGRGYAISSPADVEASTMLEYVEDEAYHQYTKNHDHESFVAARSVAQQSLRAAIARDNRVSLNGHSWLPYNTSSSWWLSGGFYTVNQPTA